MVRLPEYSRDRLRQLRADTGICYDERAQGALQLFRTRKPLDGAGADIEILRRFGVPFEAIGRDGCIRHEPALARDREKFVGGLRLPGDETGDCFKFTQNLASLAADLGVDFRFGMRVTRRAATADRVDGVATSSGAVVADTYVLALGSYSPLLVKPLGVDLPV